MLVCAPFSFAGPLGVHVAAFPHSFKFSRHTDHTNFTICRKLDVKALKSALANRDSQLAAAEERIKELEVTLAR